MLGVVLLICVGAINTSAYDNDTHFWLTYYLSRKAGFTQIQATQIASANISVDLDVDTRPVTPKPRSLDEVIYFFNHMQAVHASLHALAYKNVGNDCSKGCSYWDPYPVSEKTEREKSLAWVSGRKKEYWGKILKLPEKNPGAFLHFLQDSSAHQYFAGLVGHAGFDGTDFISTDVPKAKDMTQMTLRYLIAFRKEMAGDFKGEGLDPESIDLKLELGTSVLSEINSLVESLSVINFFKDRLPNEIVKEWELLIEKKPERRTQFGRTLWDLRAVLLNQK